MLVGTIAFGLGINKPGVRAVIHLSLPKSLEQYYQEAGRAGRDGLPSDCVLLWQKKDTALLAYFIDQLKGAAEQQRSWQRYRDIKGFVESERCRQIQICRHFGENPKWATCDACDICAGPPAWLSGERAPSAVQEKLRPVPAPVDAPSPCSPELLAYMREWRGNISRAQNIPAFVVLHDTSLEDLCRKDPRSLTALRQVSGIGESKARLYGPGILDALEQFRRGARATERPLFSSKPPVPPLAIDALGTAADRLPTPHPRREESQPSSPAAPPTRFESRNHPRTKSCQLHRS